MVTMGRLPVLSLALQSFLKNILDVADNLERAYGAVPADALSEEEGKVGRAVQELEQEQENLYTVHAHVQGSGTLVTTSVARRHGCMGCSTAAVTPMPTTAVATLCSF